MSTRPWTPADLDGKALWIVADDVDVIERDGLIYALTNRASGLSVTPGIASLSNYLFERGDPLEGRLTMRATTAHQGWFAAAGTEEAISGVTGISCFAVQRQRERGPSASYRAILSAQRVGLVTSRFVFWQDAYVGGALSTTCAFGTSSNVNANAAEAGVDWAVIAGIADWSDSSTVTRIDGAQRARATTAVSVPANETGAAGSTIQIGGRWSGAATPTYPNPLQDLAELVLFNRAVEGDDLARVEGYLAWTWGLQDRLDAAHPYKNAAPTVEIPDPPGPTPGPMSSRIPPSVESYLRRVCNQGEAWDMIAGEFYNDEFLMDRVLRANPDLSDIVLFSGGETIAVPVLPVAEVQAPESLPPWRRP